MQLESGVATELVTAWLFAAVAEDLRGGRHAFGPARGHSGREQRAELIQSVGALVAREQVIVAAFAVGGYLRK